VIRTGGDALGRHAWVGPGLILVRSFSFGGDPNLRGSAALKERYADKTGFN